MSHHNLVTSESISELEKQLQQAMLASNVEVLNTLLADDLIFTNHLGHILTKQDDLAAHKSQKFVIKKLELSEQKTQSFTELAVVSVRASIRGFYEGVETEGDFRFTRVWSKEKTTQWQVVAAHASLVK